VFLAGYRAAIGDCPSFPRNEASFSQLIGRLSTNLPALQEGAVPVMFALLDARSMTCG
jgi:hypothetical protein